MAQTLVTLARRTTSMQGIRSVVHTMKTLSAINAAPYARAAGAIGAYHEVVLEGLHAFFSRSGFVRAPMSGMSGEDAKVLVVFGSDHGLCGNYNEALAAYVQQNNDADAKTLLCIGAQMQDALDDQGLHTDQMFFPPASVDGIGRLANLLTQKLDEIRQKHAPHDITVSLAYWVRTDAGMQTPVIIPLLPLDPDLVAGLMAKPWTSRSLPAYSMETDELFMALLREHLFASLYLGAAEALVTENAARLALMQQAEHSVDDRLETLKSDTRALRQSEITTELSDVIIGFEALKKDKRARR